MRLKAFSAATMAQAMAEVRACLGEDAIIVSTRKDGRGGGATVMAAVDARVPDLNPEPFAGDGGPGGPGDPLDALDDILAFHRVPPAVADALTGAARMLDAATPVALLAGALDMRLGFRPLLPAGKGGTMVLMGPAGAGKTVAAAKIAAAGLLAGRPVRLVNADTARAGGGARLRALADRLELPMEDAEHPAAIEEHAVASATELVVVDMPGANPFDTEETDELRGLLAGLDATRLLVLPAGGDTMETADQALAFSALGAQALIVTRLDAAIRYGGALAAAHAASLPFTAAGIRPQIGNGLTSLNPMSLARSLAARSHGWDSPFASAEHAA